MIDTVLFGYADRKVVSFLEFRELLVLQEKRLGTRTRKTGKGLGASKRRRRASRQRQALFQANTLNTVKEWGRLFRTF